MVLEPHHDRLRRCCEKARYPPPQTSPPKPSKECRGAMQDEQIKISPNQVEKASEPVTECDSIIPAPTIIEPATIIPRLEWPLPPSEIHDGRLYRKVG
ncbi:hypothetical protein DDE82_004379 [Stemphylium lycopersici]|uniref:Uncharacterized protein n=1 Tax=Stemphylium lycopersici TaxID=183478 RepID=A0A364N667_STELY|nr:hypothetical protein TW65_05749 [Stemphylium lycopersici]RAR04665.1 hypothetical protein DDE82_004379 [Stemphylium lycopersici]RAR12809.1 hypothetical protein DDE83_003844 [Stemphylium lycopersici]